MKLPIRLSQDSREPIYYQIEEQIKALIASGQLPAGTLLPSIRALSNELGISIITTRRAYQNLEQQGFIKTSQGKGTFVAQVEKELKEEITIASVRLAFKAAIETALRHNYTVEQIEILFEKMLSRYKQTGEER